MKKIMATLSVLIFPLLLIGPAYGWDVSGRILCITDNDEVPLANVKVTVTGVNFSQFAMTDSQGYYFVNLLDVPMNYSLKIDGLPPDAILIVPSSNPFPFELTPSIVRAEVNVVFSSQICKGGACWLTAGGVKFDPVLRINAGEHGPKFSFGGVTYPGCSPDASDGGQWNFVDHALKYHFQGWSVTQVTCGNVAGIPPGSTSPRTPFNYIDFSGVGTMKGIAGNKVTIDPVYFFVHAEDRNEPGNEKALLPGGGELIDRLFLNVCTVPPAWPYGQCPTGTSIYSLGTYDSPLTITGGNLQIHISSCP
jgi:hypothetical protein